jgi:chromosome segregation ATPase
MSLNREKTKCAKLEQQLSMLQKQLEEKSKENSKMQSDAQFSISSNELIRSLRSKNDKLTQKNAELQQQIATIKSDYSKLKNVLQREIMGSDISQKQNEEFEALLEKIVNGTNDLDSEKYSWRGRAQQIVLLKAKTKEWKRKYMSLLSSSTESSLSTRSSSPLPTDVDDKTRKQIEKLESKSRFELAELKKEVVEKNEQITEFKKKIEAMGARIKNLEKSNQEMKAKLSRVFLKSANDDKLIEALKSELEKKSKISS